MQFSGNLKPRHRRNSEDEEANDFRGKMAKRNSAALMKVVCSPIDITDETKSNLGKVHYHLAVLHGMERFPEIVPDSIDHDDPPSHDVFSVIFHLSQHL